MAETEDNIEIEETKEYLECVLTEKELLLRSKELAKANEDLVAADNKKKDIMADITAQIKRHEANISALARVVSNGKEYRDVHCEWHINYTRGVKDLIRTDTFETIKTVKINHNERQAPLV